jgi:hypothetical protein
MKSYKPVNDRSLAEINRMNRTRHATNFSRDEAGEGAEAKRIRAEMDKVKSDSSLSEGQKNSKLAQLEKELSEANKDL